MYTLSVSFAAQRQLPSPLWQAVRLRLLFASLILASVFVGSGQLVLVAGLNRRVGIPDVVFATADMMVKAVWHHHQYHPSPNPNPDPNLSPNPT